MRWFKSRNGTLPWRVDAVVAISYGAHRKGLTKASEIAVERVRALQRRYPGAKIFYGGFAGNPDPVIEEREKRELLSDGIYTGAVGTSFEEARAMRVAITRVVASHSPRVIVIVADKWFALRARTIWEAEWSNAVPVPRLHFDTFSWPPDTSNPMIFQRSPIVWALLNLVMAAAMATKCGFGFFRKRNFRQPT